MAVLKKFRSRWWSQTDLPQDPEKKEKVPTPSWGMSYDIRPLTISQLDECWRLDQRCFIDGEAYSRETFDYLLTAPESVSFRAVTTGRRDGRVCNRTGRTRSHWTRHDRRRRA